MNEDEDQMNNLGNTSEARNISERKKSSVSHIFKNHSRKLKKKIKSVFLEKKF